MRSVSLKSAVLIQRTYSTLHSVPRFRLTSHHFSTVSNITATIIILKIFTAKKMNPCEFMKYLLQ